MIFTDNEKKRCIEYLNGLIEHYYSVDNLTSFDELISKCDTMEKKYSRGGIYVFRGIYCPSLLFELLVSNINRGKLLKRISNRLPDYTYYFNDADELVLVSRLCGTESESFDFIICESDREEVSISKLRGDKKMSTLRICKTYFDEKHRMIKNIMSSVFMDIENGEIERFDIFVDEYYFESVLKKGSILHITSPYSGEAHGTEHSYEFIYDECNQLKGYHIDNNRGELLKLPEYLIPLILQQNK